MKANKRSKHSKLREQHKLDMNKHRLKFARYCFPRCHGRKKYDFYLFKTTSGSIHTIKNVVERY